MKGYVKVCVPSAAVSGAFHRASISEDTDVVLLVRPGLYHEDVVDLLNDMLKSVTPDDQPTKLDWKE